MQISPRGKLRVAWRSAVTAVGPDPHPGYIRAARNGVARRGGIGREPPASNALLTAPSCANARGCWAIAPHA